MKKYLLLFLGFLVLTGWGCDKKEGQAPDNAQNIAPSSTVNEIKSEPVLDYDTVVLSDEEYGYSYEVKFPRFKGNEEYVAVVNEYLDDSANIEVNNFLKDYKEMNHEYDPGPWFLEYDYKITRNDEYFLSVVMEGSIYAGGAHPNQIYLTFVFNLEEGGELMAIEDIFNPMATKIDEDSGARLNWLDYVSNIARLELMKEEYAEPDWINSGAGPNADNYRLFYLTEDAINFIFPPYQVAAYAAGPKEVAISYDELGGLLKAYAF